MASVTRRKFSAAAAAATLSSAALTAAAAERVSPNERIRVGLIGCGGMGKGDLATFLRAPEVHCAIICDVDDAQIAATIKMLKKLNRPEPDTVKDFRRLLDRKDIDAVIVATPDHWHALPTIYACQAGKDVYCEKPLATSIGEGRVMVQAARKYGRIVQMGTQWRSGTHYQDAVRFVQSGKLGKIRLVRCWACLTWVGSIDHPKDCDPPPGVDYDMWLGPAPKRPFNPARFHFNFRWFWDYAGGLMTDWGVHLINLAQWAMQVRAPKAVSAAGGKFVIDDIAETPDTQCVLFEFGDFVMTWEHQMAGCHGVRRREHGVEFVGANGSLVLDSSGWEVIPVKGKGLEPQKGPSTERESRWNHIRNFLDCMRSRNRPVTDIEIGHYASATPHLGNISLRTGRKVRWDAEQERIIGDPDANKLLTKPYRKPWKLPKIT